ncbi:MAG TPA: ABC transporter substrate-binding protein [Tepidisphaeraceae bacterium]|jgi:NitT/TauT family transport system substrate-binding protein|nr:ABC transporter substrate-binding protein [Tepidisphaeraceae bacterium]
MHFRPNINKYRNTYRRNGGVVLAIILILAAAGCQKKQTASKPLKVVRIGYFGNLTHAQAVLGVSSGEFADAVRPLPLKTQVFNAGPSLIEALLAGEIDIGYVGPGPALNGYLKTDGEGLRVIAGAAANGVLIVARKDSSITRFEDLTGKIIATPQEGNTQDIAAKYYITHVLHQKNFNNIRPIPNAEQSGLMQRGEIDAAWAPEPWGSRLIAESGGHLVGAEKDLWPDHEFALTLVITTPDFLKYHPDVVRRILEVHHRWTARLQQDPQRYVSQLEDALYAINGKKLPRGVLKSSIKAVKFTDDPLADTIGTMADWAYELDFARTRADVKGLLDTSLMDRIKAEDRAKGN